MLASSSRDFGASGSSTLMTIKLLTVGLIMTIILAGGGFVYVAQRFDAATEAATIAGLQAKHTEQKTKILENELHKFRAEFRKVSDGMKANSDLEPILKRLDTLEMDILDIDFDLNDRIDALVETGSATDDDYSF